MSAGRREERNEIGEVPPKRARGEKGYERRKAEKVTPIKEVYHKKMSGKVWPDKVQATFFHLTQSFPKLTGKSMKPEIKKELKGGNPSM